MIRIFTLVCVFLLVAGWLKASTGTSPKAILREAEAHYARHAYTEALEHLALYEEARGRMKPSAQLLRIQCFFGLGHLQAAQEAITQFESMRASRKKKFAKALDLIRVKLAQRIREYEELMENGSRLSNAGQYEAAIKCFTHALEIDSFQGSDYYDRGLALALSSKYPDAIQDFNRAIVRNFVSPKAFYLRGYSAFYLGDTCLALRDFNQSLRMDPRLEEAYVFRGILHLDGRRYREAADDLDQAIRINPKNDMARFYRAFLHQSQNELGDALAAYTKVAELNPDYENIYFNRGTVKHELGDYDGAIADYTHHLKENPKDDLAYNRRGAAEAMLALLLGDKQHRQAIADYTRAIELNTGEPRYFRNRAFSYRELSQYPQAISDYKRALALDSTQADDFVSLGIVLSLAGKRKDAISVFDRAIRLFPKDGKAWYFRGLAKKELGHHPEGNVDIRTARRLGWEQGVLQPY